MKDIITTLPIDCQLGCDEYVVIEDGCHIQHSSVCTNVQLQELL
jgi:hypothetical protein